MRNASIIRAMIMEYATLKRRSNSKWLHGATSPKTINFILVAVRTWNLTFIVFGIPCISNSDNIVTYFHGGFFDVTHQEKKKKGRFLWPQGVKISDCYCRMTDQYAGYCKSLSEVYECVNFECKLCRVQDSDRAAYVEQLKNWNDGCSFKDAFSITRLYIVDDRVVSEWWTGKDLLGIGRGLILRSYPGIHWRNWGKQGNPKSGQSVAGTENRTQDLRNRSRGVNPWITTFSLKWWKMNLNP
jgi:hypothetical protein